MFTRKVYEHAHITLIAESDLEGTFNLYQIMVKKDYIQQATTHQTKY